MKNWKEIIQQQIFRYVDHTNIAYFRDEPYTAITSFAIDDALAISVSDQLSPPVMRLWVHPKTIVLGIPDARLPFIEAGIEHLKKQGYHVIVRNSGGLAVALDDGVLNLSLVLPDVKQISIHDGYEAMVRFIQHMFRDLTGQIKAYEVVGSYCPGDYDLSINGKKFAGISQRRVKNGASIQIYLDIEGNSFERAAHIRDFYRTSKQDRPTKFNYPDVNPEVMGSLSDLLNVPLTVEEVKQRAYQALTDFSVQIASREFSAEEISFFNKRLEQMKKRNEKIAAL
ncbi:lipoate--protein ligase family protein [Virgibacillus sp. YIM 98842]|uniref:lipoate--protein ligase family protein n=1 Tax=Virgibacillus sp. YIM 98842 TaxID=2663533 RepID=UPI0013DCB194|nr:lipoate--protein ligase family protein [Virgibacillus sp. YIM 98842]